MARSIGSLALSSALCAFALAASAEPADPRVERLKAEEQALSKDVARLKLRHNAEGLARRWQKLAVSSSGATKQAALEGEARARALLARWSGTREDKASAERAEAAAEKARAAAARATKGEGRARASKPPAAEPIEARKARAAEAKPETAAIDALELETRELGVELLLPADVELRAKIERLPETKAMGPRVVFDLSPMLASKAARRAVPIDHPRVIGLRVAQFADDTVRFVFELPRGDLGADLAELVRPAEGKPRLRLGRAGAWDEPKPSANDPLAALLEVQRALSTVAPGESMTVTPDARAALEAMVAELDGDAERRAEAAPKPRAEPELRIEPRPVDRANLVRIRRVLIDAGHGGKDGGASGKKGTKEKDVNLGIALALAKVLREKHGLEVVLTRSTDVYLSLGRRVEIANKSGADLFVSVHSNAHRSRKFHGIETYYLNTTSSRYANRLAARENQEQFDESTLDAGDPSELSADDDGGALPGGGLGRDLRLLLADLAMRSATDDSRRLAGLVQSNLVTRVRAEHKDANDLGVKHALFYVLLGSRMPSILVESGFLSHPEEERRLADPSYQRRVAEGIAAGIGQFVAARNQIASRL